MQKWVDELASGASGWLGSTTGVIDGTMITVARFDTAENARRNRDRPEQGRWWAETQQLFAGEAIFEDSTEVNDYVVGDPDTTGFRPGHAGPGE
jgi:hypothetical protein